MNCAQLNHQQYHAGAAYALFRQELPWDKLTPHAKQVVLKCIAAAGEDGRYSGDRQLVDPHNVHRDENAEGPSAINRYHAWLRGMCCDATPLGVVLDNGLVADMAFSGGRLVCYRHHTLLVIGGAASRSPISPGHADPPQMPHASRSRLAPATSAPSRDSTAPGEPLDHSRRHEPMELQALPWPVRLSRVEAGGGRRVRVLPCGFTMPPVEGCAAVSYGGCVLVHGGLSPSGEANNNLRALLMEPDTDPAAAGEYRLVGRAILEQTDGEATGAAAAAAGGSGGGGGVASEGLPRVAPQPRAWWQPVICTAESVEARQRVASEPHQPCPPPSPRYGHHLAVDRNTCRLWLYGGRTRRTHRSSWNGTDWHLDQPLGSGSDDDADRPADPQPCCYWAQLPGGVHHGTCTVAGDGTAGLQDTGNGADAARNRVTLVDEHPGGSAVPQRVQWRRLILHAARPAGRPPSTLPNPLRTVAIAVDAGHMYILSSGRVAPGPATPAASVTGCGGCTVPLGGYPYRWLLHRVDLNNGEVELLPQQPEGREEEGGAVRKQPTANLPSRSEDAHEAASRVPCPAGAGAGAGGGGGGGGRLHLSTPPSTTAPTNQLAAAATGRCRPPDFHPDAIAMTDDTLPYIYLYGASQRGAGVGASFAASALHRLDLRCGGVWSVVETVGSSRLHAARGALGVASCGRVVLLGGVRDSRRGVEVQVQLAAPTIATPAATPTTCTAPHGSSTADASFARCRRLIQDQLRRVAPRQVAFAHPQAGDSGSGADRPCAPRRRPAVTLLAALSLYSRGSLFDDLFEELNDESLSCGAGGDAEPGGPRGITLPGHDPLAVAAVVAWVGGRSCVRAEWGVAFLAQMFRVAHCLALTPLASELVRHLSARVAAGRMEPEELIAAVGLWSDIRRLGVEVAAARGIDAALRQQLARAAAGCHVHRGNLSQVMEAVEAEMGAVEGDFRAALAQLRMACVGVAEGLLAGAELRTAAEGGGEQVRSAARGDSDGCGDTEAVVIAAVFAVRFRQLPLLYRAMRWWRRRLARVVRQGETVRQLGVLMAQLKALPPAAAASLGPPRSLTPAKRPRVPHDVTDVNAGGESADREVQRNGGDGEGSDADSAAHVTSPAVHPASRSGSSSALATQLRCFLELQLLRSVRTRAPPPASAEATAAHQQPYPATAALLLGAQPLLAQWELWQQAQHPLRPAAAAAPELQQPQ